VWTTAFKNNVYEQLTLVSLITAFIKVVEYSKTETSPKYTLLALELGILRRGIQVDTHLVPGESTGIELYHSRNEPEVMLIWMAGTARKSSKMPAGG
jgi:hypothetical protein